MPDAVNNPDKELFDQLNAKHPVYEEWADTWRIHKDVLGQTKVDKSNYLPRNQLEPEDQYQFRVELSEFIPETPLTISRLIGSLYKEKPKRDLKGQAERLEELVNNTDLKGQHLNAFMERFIFDLIGYGTMRILVNTRTPKLSTDEQGQPLLISRAMEIESGARPYLIPYTPLSTIDWDFDEFNELTMVRIKETRFGKLDSSDPTSKHVRFIKFVQYDRIFSRWWTFIEDSEVRLSMGGIEMSKPQLLVEQSGESEHGLGLVPMVVVYWPQELEPMVGNSYVRQMVKADIQKFRTESDMDYDNYLHAHPQLKVHTLDEMSNVGVGSGSFLKLNPGGGGMEREDVNYVQTPVSAFEALREQKLDKLDTINRHANTDPMGVVSRRRAIPQASGVARAWSFGTSEARILSDLADTAVVTERALFDMSIRTITADEDLNDQDDVFEGEIQYPEEFDLSSTQTLLDETEQISRNVNSPTLIKILHKRIAASKVGDVTPQIMEQIQTEIESRPLINTPAGRVDILRMPDDDNSSFGGDDDNSNARNSKESPPSTSTASASQARPGQGAREARLGLDGRANNQGRSRNRRSPRNRNAG